MSKPAPGPVRRLEIFTGSGRRRRWPASVKAQIVAESCAGTETVSAVARRHGLSVSQLFTWRRQARAGGLEADAGTGWFVPLVVSAAEAGSTSAPVGVAITVAGATLHVPPGLSPATITVLIRAIRAAS